MASAWALWQERNNRKFNHKSSSAIQLLDSILYFVSFWAGNLELPKKRKADTSILTYACKKLRCSGIGRSSAGCTGCTVSNLPLLSSAVGSTAVCASPTCSGGNLDLVVYDAQALEEEDAG